jgi:flagellar biosynthesis protein FlhF
MRILKFEGATMRDAVAKVKAELGDQAVIIATRQVRSGLLGGTAIEISAAIDDDDNATKPFAKRAPTQPPPPAAKPEPDMEKIIAPLRTELRSLRAMVRTSGDSRGTAELKAELAALRKLVEDARTPIADDRPATTPLSKPSNARVIMLAGPTGAGKTTTIAKLAARAALIEGKRVKLITLDTYRVGGIEQIKTFAELIGVELDVLESPAHLAHVLDDSYDLVLIDTAGRSPRDTSAIDELATIVPSLGIELHIVIPAAYSAAQVDALVARYRKLRPARLLFTKIDEVDQAPELAAAPPRTRLPITWITCGQAVPEDLEEPTPERLLELAAPVAQKAAS